MRLLALVLALALALAGCGSDSEERAAPPAAATASEAPRPRRCGADVAYEGGQILESPDGARIHYRVAGPESGPVAVFLHGGPGYNAYGFERAVGERLEEALRMVYLDQRGCGRSAGGASEIPLGMDPTIADLERLREHLGVERWSVIGHSFGGLLALVYATRHASAIDRVVMIEATADVHAALEHQVQALGEAPSSPEVQAIAHEDGPPIDRMVRIYQMIGRVEVQRRLHWASPEAQRRAEAWDQQAMLLECTRDGVLDSYRGAGWTDAHPELMQRIERPSLLMVGRRSRVLGEDVVQRSVEAWGARLVQMEESGHFPFVEEPDRFVEVVVPFVRGTDEAAPAAAP